MNREYVSAPYFGFIRDLIRRAEGLADAGYPSREHARTGALYEQETLINIVGELECIRGECERRIKFLEAFAAEDV